MLPGSQTSDKSLHSVLYFYQVRLDNGYGPCALRTLAANIRKMLWKGQMERAINAFANRFMCSVSLFQTISTSIFQKISQGSTWSVTWWHHSTCVSLVSWVFPKCIYTLNSNVYPLGYEIMESVIALVWQSYTSV